MDSHAPAIAAAGASVKRCCSRVGRILVALVLISWTGWSTLAIYYSNLPRPARAGAAALFPFIAAAFYRFVRPRRRAVLATFLLQGAILAWWLAIPPSNDRQWQSEVS